MQLGCLDAGDVQDYITPALVGGLGAAAALTSLTIEGGLMQAQWQQGQAAVESLCNAIAALKGLQYLTIRLPLGVSALSLSRLTQLKQLSLQYCGLPDMVVTALGCSLKQLRKLRLRGNDDLTDGCMPALGQLTALTLLGIGGYVTMGHVTEGGLMQLTGLRHLQELDIIDPEFIPEGLVLALPWLRPG